MTNESDTRARRGRLACALACLLAACCVLCGGGSARAQGEGQAAPPPPSGDAAGTAARKLSEYVNEFTSCNAGAHLDNLAVMLQQQPRARGHVRIYGPAGEYVRFGARAAKATKGYLVVTRGVEESRVEVVYGGVYSSKTELLTEVWLIPEGAAPPPAVEYANDAAAFEGKFAEFETWDDTTTGIYDGEGWSTREEVAAVGLSDVLRQKGGTHAYLVVFSGEETAPGAWRRIAERETGLLKKHGVAEERVRVIYGGYRKEPAVQFWVLPEDAPPPAKDAGRERRPEKAVQLGSFGSPELKYTGAARKVFGDFAAILKADETLTATVVIRLGAPEEDEPPDVDFVQLVERWKADLVKEFGVGAYRLNVIVVPPVAGSASGGSVETWIVPPGVAPPNPFAAEEEEEAREPGDEKSPPKF